MVLKYSRIQSPSSINTYRQCPRKYYYIYIEKRKTSKNIHLVRGSIAHSVLENFFTIKLNDNEPCLGDKLINWINELFENEWSSKKKELCELDMTSQELKYYYNETKEMLNTWLFSFFKRLRDLDSNNPINAFKTLTPEMEVLYKSDNLGVLGYIDVIEKVGENISLIDYKTSKAAKISDDYKLQLAIYAMLYKEKHGIAPNKVGISFLKFGETHELMVNQDLIDYALLEVELIHANTQTKNIIDYPKNITPLCKWSSGQCDFYDICQKCNQRNLSDF
jgi:putative RecB family exonuclease